MSKGQMIVNSNLIPLALEKPDQERTFLNGVGSAPDCLPVPQSRAKCILRIPTALAPGSVALRNKPEATMTECHATVFPRNPLFSRRRFADDVVTLGIVTLASSGDGMLDECLKARTVAIGSRRRSFLTAFGSTSGSV